MRLYPDGERLHQAHAGVRIRRPEQRAAWAKGITTRDEDTVVDVFTASTHDYILFFTDTGKVYRKKGYQIPEAARPPRA